MSFIYILVKAKYLFLMQHWLFYTFTVATLHAHYIFTLHARRRNVLTLRSIRYKNTVCTLHVS